MIRFRFEVYSTDVLEGLKAFQDVAERLRGVIDSGEDVTDFDELCRRLIEGHQGKIDIGVKCSSKMKSGQECGNYTSKQHSDGSFVCGTHLKGLKSSEGSP